MGAAFVGHEIPSTRKSLFHLPRSHSWIELAMLTLSILVSTIATVILDPAEAQNRVEAWVQTHQLTRTLHREVENAPAFYNQLSPVGDGALDAPF